MSEPTPVQDAVQAQKVAAITIAEYDGMAAANRRARRGGASRRSRASSKFARRASHGEGR